jgi:hypothetical protein
LVNARKQQMKLRNDAWTARLLSSQANSHK